MNLLACCLILSSSWLLGDVGYFDTEVLLCDLLSFISDHYALFYMICLVRTDLYASYMCYLKKSSSICVHTMCFAHQYMNIWSTTCPLAWSDQYPDEKRS